MKPTDWIALFTALVALIAGGLAFIGTRQTIKASKESSEKSNELSIKLGNLSAVTQGKQRLIETISAQRVEWINSVREKFSQFSKLTYEMAGLRGKNEEIPDKLKYELFYHVNHIELFLNPTEIITNRFIELKDRVSSHLLFEENFSGEYYEELMFSLHYVEQVILKSEWKRLKEETKNGLEVPYMEEIHKKIAQKIDKEKYNSILKQYYEVSNN